MAFEDKYLWRNRSLSQGEKFGFTVIKDYFVKRNRQKQQCIEACYCLKYTQCVREMNKKTKYLTVS